MKKTIKTFILAIGISTCISACSNQEVSSDEILQRNGETCLVDFIDPQDKEGFIDEFDLQNIINDYEKTWADRNFRPVDSFYSESNHLYIMNGDCPFVLDFNIENIEPSTFYSVPAPIVLEDLGHKDYSTSNFPNDPLYKHQWNFEKLDMEKAWKNSKQGEGVIVAVIDTGVAYKDYEGHAALEDLNNTKFTKGVTFSSGLPDGLDDHSHGSHVAGTIAQSTNNGRGVSGIAPKATIMPLKVLSAQGYGSVEDIASAIRYATDNGAKVINMSLGGPQRSQILKDAVDYAYEHGVTVVCAAGNDNSRHVGYPAGYENCISVGATDKNDDRSFYSNYGDGVTLSAPGGDTRIDPFDGILQNTINPRKPSEAGAYYAYQGTSMAAPHVAGVAALIVGEGIVDPAEVERILVETATDIENKDMGSGLLNANMAVIEAKNENGNGFEWHTWKIVLIGGLIVILLVFIGYKSYNAIMSIEKDYDKYYEDPLEEDDIG